MKRLFALLLAALFALSLSCASAESEGATALVVYFSHAGENYNVGMIEEGNTARLAKIIAAETGADLFELEPVVPYPEDYNGCLEAATEEQRADARPEFVGEIENWDQYQTVFIGYPIWWGNIPNIVYTFMEGYDFAGKTVVPFNTHEGSGQARSQQDIVQTLPTATVLQGLAVTGRTAQNDADATLEAVTKWLADLGL